MLYLIGLGLNADDISLRAREIIQKCSKVFLEAYTSILLSYDDMLRLVQEVLQRDDLVQADRKMVEEQAEEIILPPAMTGDVAFLVAGDALCATTHCDLYLRAIEKGIPVKVIHNASIVNAISGTGLQVYKFGWTVSVPFFDGTWRPASFLDRCAANLGLKMHTLFLLDIKTKEQNLEALMHGREVYDPPRFMLCPVAARQISWLLENGEQRDLYRERGLTSETLCVACMRVGTDTQQFVCTTLGALAQMEDGALGGPLHCLVIPGELSDMEARMLLLWVRPEDAEVRSRLAEIAAA